MEQNFKKALLIAIILTMQKLINFSSESDNKKN